MKPLCRGAVCAVGVAVALCAAPAQASNTIGSIRVDPAKAMAGTVVTIIVSSDVSDAAHCALYLEYGDGEGVDIRVSGKDGIFPKTLKRAYAKPGTYAVRAVGKKVATLPACLGSASAKVIVEAVPQPGRPARR